MARTDALAVEGMESAIERAIACVDDPGADMIFPEAIITWSNTKSLSAAVKKSRLSEYYPSWRQTHCFSKRRLASVGVDWCFTL